MSLHRIFETTYQSHPSHQVRSPGRVNLIGEHTDYNNGFVLPIAIEHAIDVVMQPRQDHIVSITLAQTHQTETFTLHQLNGESNGWLLYAKAAAQALITKYPCEQGFNATLNSNLPQGAGLSSSAAFLLAILQCLCISNQIPWDGLEMAQLAALAENQFVGVNCGIMDPTVIALAKAQHALLIDCKNLHINPVRLPNNVDFIIMDTQTRRGLVDSEYNERRTQCEQASERLSLPSLREIDYTSLLSQQAQLTVKQFQYAKHVVTENQRVLDACEALQALHIERFGHYLNQSHASLRDDFAVSTPALNSIVEIAQHTPGCFGARMTGAGFGGCAIAVVDQNYSEVFSHHVMTSYQQHTQRQATLHKTVATDCAQHRCIMDYQSLHATAHD